MVSIYDLEQAFHVFLKPGEQLSIERPPYKDGRLQINLTDHGINTPKVRAKAMLANVADYITNKEFDSGNAV